jgi:hypothetical protein
LKEEDFTNLDGLKSSNDLEKDKISDSTGDDFIDLDELDGEENNNNEIVKLETDQPMNEDGYTIRNVHDQLNGIVNNWFQFAVNMKPEEKEKFLALGERLSEITDIVKTEFMK